MGAWKPQESKHLRCIGLAAKGADCWSPSSLVSALARNEGVRIIPVPKDDPRLEGAEGVWDPESRFVYQLKSGDAFKDAFVAAHELGHAVHRRIVDEGLQPNHRSLQGQRGS